MKESRVTFQLPRKLLPWEESVKHIFLRNPIISDVGTLSPGLWFIVENINPFFAFTKKISSKPDYLSSIPTALKTNEVMLTYMIKHQTKALREAPFRFLIPKKRGGKSLTLVHTEALLHLTHRNSATLYSKAQCPESPESWLNQMCAWLRSFNPANVVLHPPSKVMIAPRPHQEQPPKQHYPGGRPKKGLIELSGRSLRRVVGGFLLRGGGGVDQLEERAKHLVTSTLAVEKGVVLASVAADSGRAERLKRKIQCAAGEDIGEKFATRVEAALYAKDKASISDKNVQVCCCC